MLSAFLLYPIKGKEVRGKLNTFKRHQPTTRTHTNKKNHEKKKNQSISKENDDVCLRGWWD